MTIQPTTQLALFDYAALDSETRIVVQQRTTEIKGLMRRAAQDIIEIGHKLIEVKARLGHGHFGGWLRAEFEWSADTASNFMRVAQRFGDFPKISEIAPSALYLLAAPSTPDAAREEAIARAESGETISYSAAREIVEEHKAQTAPEDGAVGAAGEPLPFVPERATNGTHDTCDTDDNWYDEPLTPHEAQIAAAYVAPQTPTPVEPEPAKPAPMAVHFSSATPEWYTPQHIIERVVNLFGHIDLDPCSNDHGDAANVPARVHYTADDDGLSQPWRIGAYLDDHGEECHAVRVYMNPPYGDEIVPWIERLVRAYVTGEITEAVALLPARVDTGWWEKLRAYPWCAVRGRLRFVGAESGAPFPSAIVYLGRDLDGFDDSFGDLGIIYEPRCR